MGAYNFGRLRARNAYEFPRLGVDAAPTVPGNIADCLEVHDRAIRLNDPGLNLDDAAERAFGTGVTKMSWAEAPKATVRLARRTHEGAASKRNRERI